MKKTHTIEIKTKDLFTPEYVDELTLKILDDHVAKNKEYFDSFDSDVEKSGLAIMIKSKIEDIVRKL